MKAKNYHDVHLSLPQEASNRFRDFEGLCTQDEVLAKCKLGESYVWDLLEIEDKDILCMVRDMTINLVNEQINACDELTENEAFLITHTVYEIISVRWWMKTHIPTITSTQGDQE